MNPFRSEASAYRFVFVAIAAAVGTAVGANAGGWVAALAVLAAIAIALLVWAHRHAVHEPPAIVHPRHADDGRRCILVVANETVEGSRLFDEIRARASGDDRILVVCPALNSALRHWASDDDAARAAAAARLESTLARLAEAGIDADGTIGDADPLQAMEDALRRFGADEIIISTHPPERSHWLERGVVERARERFPVEITHVFGAGRCTPATPS